MSAVKGYGIPLTQMSSMELGRLNRARDMSKMLPLVIGFTGTVKLEGVGETLPYVVTFTEGLNNPVCAFIGQLSRDCEAKWGQGRLDCDQHVFIWQLTALAPKPGDKR